jgi:hypothetical protein
MAMKNSTALKLAPEMQSGDIETLTGDALIRRIAEVRGEINRIMFKIRYHKRKLAKLIAEEAKEAVFA